MEKELPTGWKFVKLSEVVIKLSLNKIKLKQKEYLKEGKFPIIDQGKDLIGGYYNDEKLLVPNEPPYIVFGDHTRVKKFVSFKFIPGADGVKVLKPRGNINPKFLYYSIQAINIEDKGYARHFQLLEKEFFPLPPLHTQQAIVSKIEELFSELDKGIENLKIAQQQLKVYRQSVLKWAFEGKLTDMKQAWNSVALEEVAVVIDPQPSHRTPPIDNNGVPFVSIKDVSPTLDSINFKNARKVSYTVLEEHLDRYKVIQGDFIIGKIGTIGKPVRLSLPQNYCLSANVVVIQPRMVDGTFLYYFFQSSSVQKEFKAGAKATSQAAFGIQKVRKLTIHLPAPEDQISIVEEIESRLSVADKMEETIKQSLLQAESLRQSILKKAFEGKLLTEEIIE